MTIDGKKPDFRLLFLIIAQKLGPKAEELFSQVHVPMQYHAFAKGTASSEIVDMLGLGNIDKAVTISMLPKHFADEMLDRMRQQLYLGSPGTGVAFTIPLSGASAGVVQLLQNLEQQSGQTQESEGEQMDNQYAMILAFVDQGYSEEVMAAAKTAGAGGGTVFHSRRAGSEDADHFWGVPIQQEREIVLILAKKEDKVAVMKAIGDQCGAQSDAHGIVVSLPVDGVVGLNKYVKE